MLSPSSFTAGTFANARQLSLFLVLSQAEWEETALIGIVEGAPVAVLLSEQYPLQFLPCMDENAWHGLIIPDVRIEVDESSVFNAENKRTPGGSVIRTDTKLIIRATNGQTTDGRLTEVTLHDDLPVADLRVGFTRWQVVLNNDENKGILWENIYSGEI